MNTNNTKISLILFIIFLLFYAFQIPLYTYKADVIAFSVRSLANYPITEYAYLNSGTLLNGESLPNYHIGHTIFLWAVYQIMPESLSSTIIPAGFISAIFGSLVVVLTFLIWQYVGIKKRTSIIIAVSFGLVPIFWEHAIIGEIHTMQMFFTLLFLYSFLKDKLVISSIAFLIANLVSPLSGLAFGLILLKGFNKTILTKAILVGSSALILYLIIFYLLGADLSNIFGTVSHQPTGRGIPYRIIIILFFILINFNLLIFYLIKGFKKTFRKEKTYCVNLALATIPQFLLIFISAGFFIELGSFQLPVFWALTFPLGVYLANIRLKSIFFITAVILSFALTQTVWISPHYSVGSSLEEAGSWLKTNKLSDISLIGTWGACIHAIYKRNGANVNYLNKYYFDKPEPNDLDLLKTKKETLIIVKQKKKWMRKTLSTMKIPGLVLNEYDPIKLISSGTVEKLFENDAVVLFRWKK